MEYIYPLIHKSLLKTHCMKSKRLSHPLFCTDWEIKKKKTIKQRKTTSLQMCTAVLLPPGHLKTGPLMCFYESAQRKDGSLSGQMEFSSCTNEFKSVFEPFYPKTFVLSLFHLSFFALFCSLCLLFPVFYDFSSHRHPLHHPSTPWLFLFLVL